MGETWLAKDGHLYLGGTWIVDFYYEDDDACPPEMADRRARIIADGMNERAALTSRLERARLAVDAHLQYLETYIDGAPGPCMKMKVQKARSVVEGIRQAFLTGEEGGRT